MIQFIKKNKYYALMLMVIILYYNLSYYKYSQHTSIDKIYIINLDRSPHRYKKMQEKLDSMNFPINYTRFSAIDGRKLQFTSHPTGETLLGQDILTKKIWLKGDFNIKCAETENKANQVLIRNLNQGAYNPRIPGEVGVACSHKKIWQEIIEKGYKNTLIIEDDIRFIPFFDKILNTAMNNTPKYYELLFLQYRNYGHAFDHKTNDAFSSLFLTFFDSYIKNPFWKRAYKDIMSSRGYILTEEGAKKLLQCEQEYAKESFMSIDVAMGKCIANKPIIAYASKPKFIYNDNAVATMSDISEPDQENAITSDK